MDNLTPVRMAAIALSLILGILMVFLSRRMKREFGEEPTTAQKKRRRRVNILAVTSFWLFCGLVIGVFNKSGSEGIHIEMLAPRMELFGFDISSSVVISWGAMLLILIPAVLIRIFVVPKFTEKPKGIQAVLEMGIEYLSSYTKEKAGFINDELNAYMFTLVMFLTSCAAVELFSFRPPTSDLVTTFSLALVTFVIINYYGIKKKGLVGRIKSFAKPMPIVFPFRVLSDIAIPVSLACRLFGNMLGGMVVLHLVYMALGSFGIGIPAVLGLYFNAFHPLIQVFIFLTLSLTFIGEAVED